MKKLFFFLLLITLGSWVSINNEHKNTNAEEAYFCGGGYYPDEEYYNLFTQEVINAPRYILSYYRTIIFIIHLRIRKI